MKKGYLKMTVEEYYQVTEKMLEKIVEEFNKEHGKIPASSLLLCLLVFSNEILEKVADKLNAFERNAVFLALNQMLGKLYGLRFFGESDECSG
jgi:hypothetical protein